MGLDNDTPDDCCCTTDVGPLVKGGQGRDEREMLGDAATLGVVIGFLLGAGALALVWAVIA